MFWCTVIEVKFTGGEYRVCLLGDEISPAHSLMRPTGDIGWVSGEGEVYFVCREDRQIKRSGHRLSLDAVEQVCKYGDEYWCVY